MQAQVKASRTSTASHRAFTHRRRCSIWCNTTSASSLVEVIDAALRSLPGRTTVRSSWWQGIIDELNLAAELELNPS